MNLSMRFTRYAVRTFFAAGLLLGIGASPTAALADGPASIQLKDDAGCDGLLAARRETADTALADCGCPPKGCVRTQGYWSNKPGVLWPSPYERSAPFFQSGLTWQEVLDSPTRGDAYFILAHQYIAAVLNGAAGTSAPNSLRAVLLGAGNWLRTATPGTCVRGACQLQRSWANVLDQYNNGNYPGAPEHCGD